MRAKYNQNYKNLGQMRGKLNSKENDTEKSGLNPKPTLSTAVNIENVSALE